MTMKELRVKEDGSTAVLPWWRVGLVWIVIAGPLAVVVAGVATSVIAFRGADIVVKTVATPAVQARNHAAAPRR